MSLPLLAIAAALLLAASLGVALYSGIPPAVLLQPEDLARAAGRCAACGRIESLRELDASLASGKAIPMREFTVRMADGSSRVFLEDAAVGWRLGERVIYIDGASGFP